MSKSITLINQNGEQKRYHRNNIKGRQAKKGVRLSLRISALSQSTRPEDIEKVEDYLDQAEDFIVKDLYGNQFTMDEFLDGIDGNNYLEFIMLQLTGSDEDAGKGL